MMSGCPVSGTHWTKVYEILIDPCLVLYTLGLVGVHTGATTASRLPDTAIFQCYTTSTPDRLKYRRGAQHEYAFLF